MSHEDVVETNEDDVGEYEMLEDNVENEREEEKKEYVPDEEMKNENALLLNEEDVELTSKLQTEDLLHIYPKLRSLGLSLRHLRSIDAEDLQALCSSLQLSLAQRIKFKSVVHALQSSKHHKIVQSPNKTNHQAQHNVAEMNNNSEEFQYLMKVILIGDSGVGKSSLLLRYSDWTFADSYISTIGVDFRFKSIKIDDDVVKMQLWDTAGQDRFRSITCAYYRGAHAIISCYDITQRESFENCKSGWMKSIQQQANPNVFVMITGCKRDLESQRKVSYHEGKQFAETLGDMSRFCEVSAKTGFKVNELFNTVAVSTLKLMKENMDPQELQRIRKPRQNQQVNNQQLQDDSWWNYATNASCC